MITFEELKAIEKSPYYDTFKQNITQLSASLFTLLNDAHMNKNGEDSISEENMGLLGYYRTYLRNLVYGETDEIKRKSLEYLREFPDFLAKPAFENHVNSPTILERMYEVEQLSNYRAADLKKGLGNAVRALELDLNDELCREKLGTDREIWSKPAPEKIPTREEARPGSWAALFYKLTKDSAKPNPHKDVSVYENKFSDNTLLRLAAMVHVAQREGNNPVPIKTELEKELSNLRKDPLAVMTLRNEHTVELLRRGDHTEVGKRLNQTKEDFKFGSDRAAEDARTRAYAILKKMKNMEGKAASSKEFEALKKAVQNFATAREGEDKLERKSAKVLQAVENFTKGRKNVQRSARAQECVNLALDALVSLVPNAAGNPHVKPLIDRFNEVRSSKNRINLSDYGADRSYTAENAKEDRCKDLTAFDREAVEAAAEAMGKLHDGRIDPAVFKNISNLVITHRNELPTIMQTLKSGEESYQKASAALLEEMSENPAFLNGMIDMNPADVKQAIQSKAESLANHGILRQTVRS